MVRSAGERVHSASVVVAGCMLRGAPRRVSNQSGHRSVIWPTRRQVSYSRAYIPKISRTELWGEMVNTEVQVHRVVWANADGTERPRVINGEPVPVTRS